MRICLCRRWAIGRSLRDRRRAQLAPASFSAIAAAERNHGH